MKAYMQFFDDSGNHADPMPDQYTVVASGKEARAMFEIWMAWVGRFSDERNARALVFLGEPEGEYPCDFHPDREITVGPRGGINIYYL